MPVKLTAKSASRCVAVTVENSAHHNPVRLSAFIVEHGTTLSEWSPSLSYCRPEKRESSRYEMTLRRSSERLRSIWKQRRAEQTLKSGGGAGRRIVLLGCRRIHMLSRYAIGFDLNQLVAEYRACAGVIALWTQKMGTPIAQRWRNSRASMRPLMRCSPTP